MIFKFGILSSLIKWVISIKRNIPLSTIWRTILLKWKGVFWHNPPSDEKLDRKNIVLKVK